MISPCLFPWQLNGEPEKHVLVIKNPQGATVFLIVLCRMALVAAYAKVEPQLNLCVLSAVQAATWFKRTFALQPALNQIRKERAEHRQDQSNQVDTMY